MKLLRRVFVALAFKLALDGQQPHRELIECINSFSATYHDWVVAKDNELRHPGTVDEHALTGWLLVERRFKELNRAVMAERVY